MLRSLSWRWLFWLLLCLLVIVPASFELGSIYYYDTVARPLAAYTAALPGPGCDTGWGRWIVGTRPTEDKRAAPSTHTMLTCRPNGLQVTRKDTAAVYGDVHFFGTDLLGRDVGSAYRFPVDYRVQVCAQFLQGDPSVAVHLHVRWAEYYGGYDFEVRADGTWTVIRYDLHGAPQKRLAIGFLHQPTSRLTLAVEVHSAFMTYMLNGVLVARVYDTTYLTTSSLSFGVADSGQMVVAPSALFSAFAYQPLASLKGGLDNPPSTATYEAQTPGAGCDVGKGQWAPAGVVAEQGFKMMCQSGVLRMSYTTGSKRLGTENFYWLDGNFPQNYRTAVQIDVSKLNNGCAGLLVRGNSLTGAGGYSFSICQGGVWLFSRYDQERGHNLAVGTLRPENSYLLDIMLHDDQEHLTVNGRQLAMVQDATFSETGSIGLFIFTPLGAGTADFVHFVFAPLPD